MTTNEKMHGQKGVAITSKTLRYKQQLLGFPTVWHYLVHGRYYFTDARGVGFYQKLCWVVSFDSEDLAEYMLPENPTDEEIENLTMTDKDASRYANELAASDAAMLDEMGNRTEIVKWCQSSIDSYNQMLRRRCAA